MSNIKSFLIILKSGSRTGFSKIAILLTCSQIWMHDGMTGEILNSLMPGSPEILIYLEWVTAQESGFL